MTRKKKILFVFAAIFLSVFLTFSVFEIVFRILLYSEVEFMEKYRDPKLYADWFSDDECWLLYYHLEKKYPPPERTHPLLGWWRSFNPETYEHVDAKKIEDRQPVLFYGDSFARCHGVEAEQCFEGLLNNDPAFNQDHYLLNYGVGGYGTGQIYLVFDKSLDLYEKPFVIMSLMTFDMDRVVLSVRGGQKPYFEVNNEELELKGVPIEADAEHYFATHKPGIVSYLFRLMIYGNVLPDSWSRTLKGENAKTEEKKIINRKIFESILAKLDERNLDYLFVVFHAMWSFQNEEDWRDAFLRDFFKKKQVPNLWAKEIVKRDMNEKQKKIQDYFQANGGHPNPYHIKLISDEIKTIILNE